jgi:hypothetical protein
MAKPSNNMAQRSCRVAQARQRDVVGVGALAAALPGVGVCAGDGWLA